MGGILRLLPHTPSPFLAWDDNNLSNSLPRGPLNCCVRAPLLSFLQWYVPLPREREEDGSQSDCPRGAGAGAGVPIVSLLRPQLLMSHLSVVLKWGCGRSSLWRASLLYLRPSARARACILGAAVCVSALSGPSLFGYAVWMTGRYAILGKNAHERELPSGPGCGPHIGAKAALSLSPPSLAPPLQLNHKLHLSIMCRRE